MAFILVFAWQAIAAAAQAAPSGECESGSCEDSVMLQLRSGQRATSKSTNAAGSADLWLTRINSNAQPIEILAPQSPVSFQSASLLSTQPREPTKRRPSMLQPSLLHCETLNGAASRACEVTHANVSAQKQVPPTVQQCCSWYGAQCPGEVWCDERRLQCEGGCDGTWVTHCCSYDGFSCPANEPFCDSNAQSCSQCGGQWYALPLEATPAPTPPPTLPPGPPCCSWDGKTCKGHDWWCDSQASNCVQCAGEWIVPILAWQPVNGGTNQACRGDNPNDNSDSYYQVVTASGEDDCKYMCTQKLSTGCCTAVEFNPNDGRCELWIKNVQASTHVNGYNCFRLDPQQNCPVPDGITRVTVDASTTYQTMRGFGAAITQSSAHVLQNLKSRNRGLYNQVMNRLFGLGAQDAGISFVRFPIGSCDFSLVRKTYDDVWNDWWLDEFRLDADSEKIVATLLDAKAINSGLLLMGSPWTPPAWLKTQGTLDGNSNANTLIYTDEVYNTYANYLRKVKLTFEQRGLPLDYLTMQNEPLYAPRYPGMYLTSSNYARLGRETKAKIGNSPQLLAYDHNWDHPEYPQQVINAASGAFTGTAFHCYAGNMASANEQLHSAFPTREIFMTECTGSYPNQQCDINKGNDSFGWNHEWDMTNIFLNNNLHWGVAGIKWNMVLDESCGPVLSGVDYRWGRPLVSIPSYASNINQIKFNQDFWTVAHMGRFVRPGAQRISVVETTPGVSSIIGAFKDNAGKVTLMVVNKDHSNAMELEVTYANQVLTYSVPAWGTAVFTWPS